MSSDATEQSSALNNFLSSVNKIDKSSFKDDGEKNEALLAAYALLSRLESPWEVIARTVLTQPALNASLKIAGDLGLFEKWHDLGGGPKSSQELAKLTGCEELLLDGVFQDTMSFKGTLFEYYAANPREGATFNYAIGGVMAKQASWLDIYPHDSLLTPAEGERALTDEDVVLVDVGGNVGRDIERFRSAHPSKASSLVLQDRPEVIRQTICSEPVRAMAHDFFEPQPVKGARAYFMHSTLHDWSDEHAKKILTHLKEAMTPGWSKLLLYEYVISEDGSHPQATGYDLSMMVLVAALERTESAWHQLLESVGLKIEKIWSSKLTRQSIIEAVVAS